MKHSIYVSITMHYESRIFQKTAQNK